jgi:hypothetical protein
LAQALGFILVQRGLREIIARLKSPDEGNVAAALAELEVFRQLHLRHENTEWKPSQHRAGRSADLKIRTQDGQSVVVEVRAVRRSEERYQQQLALDEIRLFLDRLGHRYSVEYEVKGEFAPRHVEACCAFLRSCLSKLGARRTGKAQASFTANGKVLLRFRFTRTEEPGRWVAGLENVRHSEESGRIKKKLLDKLDKFQLPEGDESLKGYILVLDDLVHHAEDVRDAVLGRRGVAVTKSKGESPQLRVVRQGDGGVHDSTRGAILLSEVDFIASMTTTGGMFLTPLDVLVNGERNRVSRDDVCEVLWGSVP